LIRNASNLPIFCIGRFASIDEKFSGLIIHKIVLANEEPRSLWRTFSDSGFFGGNREQTALRADHIFASEPESLLYLAFFRTFRSWKALRFAQRRVARGER